MAALTVYEARELLFHWGADTGTDYHELDSETKNEVIKAANLRNYHAPRNANGSRGRYFFTYAARVARREP